MPSLRTLLSDLEPTPIGNAFQKVYVFNSSTAQLNGGCCCLWTVPAGITRATFEMWGAGGDGNGSRCCERQGVSPTGGSYSLVTIDVTEGTAYRICAAGSGCCNCCCGIGNTAFTSYVVNDATSALIGCATGGKGGCSQMTRGSHCSGYTCCWSQQSTEGSGDITFTGMGGQYFANNYCNMSQYEMVAGGINTAKQTGDFCVHEPTRNGPRALCQDFSSFPGGAGVAGRTCGGGYCTGMAGAGGLVILTFS